MEVKGEIDRGKEWEIKRKEEIVRKTDGGWEERRVKEKKGNENEKGMTGYGKRKSRRPKWRRKREMFGM